MIWNGGEDGSSAPLIAAPPDLPNRKFLAELDHLPGRDPPLIHDIYRSGLEDEVIYFHNVGASSLARLPLHDRDRCTKFTVSEFKLGIARA